ncbi:MAG: gliding motility-associated ABC transporter ATP-binding subunit GldA [Salinivirgaceae bacterium]|jgi:ABC-2 type transport system ATP-binding protein|nr:gliding motility-associated ABC transporter ATP-binding subunit GldA [Salinivirgaceae bacterium]
MSIQTKNLTKLYGAQKAVDDVSFEVKSGEVVGFLGPNGAGKSTTMKILTGLIPQTGGEAWVNGVNVREDSMAVRRTTGYLPENNPQYDDMFIKEYLNFVAGLYKMGSEKESRIKELISRIGLEVEQHKKIGQLSKGYRQRVGLAQALLHDPSVLILDEPTSGLDPNQIIEIRNLISSIGNKKTVLLSTHIMQEVEAICDRIVIINRGKIVADDTTANIKKKLDGKQQVIVVEFNSSPNVNKIQAVEGVLKVEKKDGNLYEITGNKNTDIRGNLFNMAVKNKLTVLSMQEKGHSLEQVFQELTSNK